MAPRANAARSNRPAPARRKACPRALDRLGHRLAKRRIGSIPFRFGPKLPSTRWRGDCIDVPRERRLTMQATQTRSADQLHRDLADWNEKFRATSDGDKELQAHGIFYTCTFLLDLDEHTVLVKMVDGKVHDLVIDPGPLDEAYQFAIRASADTWRNFATPT